MAFVIKGLIIDWHIPSKCLATMDKLLSLEHFPCLAHVLQLAINKVFTAVFYR